MQFHDASARYLHLMRKHVPLYDRVQDEVVFASVDVTVNRMLDLGVGTGETSRRCLEAHPKARSIGLDAVGTCSMRQPASWANGRSCVLDALKIRSPAEDMPDRIGDLLDSLRRAGLRPEVRWAENDLVVIAASA